VSAAVLAAAEIRNVTLSRDANRSRAGEGTLAQKEKAAAAGDSTKLPRRRVYAQAAPAG